MMEGPFCFIDKHGTTARKRRRWFSLFVSNGFGRHSMFVTELYPNHLVPLCDWRECRGNRPPNLGTLRQLKNIVVDCDLIIVTLDLNNDVVMRVRHTRDRLDLATFLPFEISDHTSSDDAHGCESESNLRQ
jgi:hypothetical protein